MSIEKKSLEILKAGLDDTLNLIDEEAMDFIEGGACIMNYCASSYCGVGFVPDPTPDPSTPEPSISPSVSPSSTPTCPCGTACQC